MHHQNGMSVLIPQALARSGTQCISAEVVKCQLFSLATLHFANYQANEL